MGILCDKPISTYTKRNCATHKLRYNSVSGVALLKPPSLVKDLTDPAIWEQYVGESPTATITDDMEIMPDFSGEYNPEYEYGDGFGDAPETPTAGTHAIVGDVVYMMENEDFYKDLLLSKNYGIAWIEGGRKDGLLKVFQRTMVRTKPMANVTRVKKDYRKFTLDTLWNDLDFYKSVAVSDEVKQLFF